MMLSIIIYSFAIVACLMLSAFFSGSEMAYSSANTVRLEKLSQTDKKAHTALFIVNNFNDALSAILIGNNLVNIAASSLGSVLVITIFGNDSMAWLSSVVITILVIIFGETIPKIRCKKSSTSSSIKYSYAVKSLMVILKPVIFVVVGLVSLICKPLQEHEEDENEDDSESVEELQSIIETAEDEGILDEDDSEIIQNAIDFNETSASEVMTARVDVQAIDIDDSFEDIIKFVLKTPYSRIPVYQNSIDNIIGVLHINMLMQSLYEDTKEFDIRSILMEPCYVYKTMKLPTVLNQLKKAKQHLAIVTDEYSGTLGVVSMEDVLEAIVGEIWDETDIIEDDVIQKTNNEFEIDGDLPISDFLELLNIPEDDFEAESETAGGWVVEMLDKFPDENDSFEYRDYCIKVIRVDGRRVEKIQVTKKITAED